MLQRAIMTMLRKTFTMLAEEVLFSFDSLLPKFVKVFPKQYKKVLAVEAAKEAQKKEEKELLGKDASGEIYRVGRKINPCFANMWEETTTKCMSKQLRYRLCGHHHMKLGYLLALPVMQHN
ncbi:hypothetical protein Cni_G10103 [Canna indica]|uniref:Uncharacterized protein n=1 Tax=Canna indica TaxID=4628 RepID=A0AAQ3K3R6_9LILI|nr:hypothetical protein Cni_G10103 [Canna indica]